MAISLIGCMRFINQFNGNTMDREYKWNAGDYDKNSQAQKKWARELIGRLNFKGNERVLDLGCGDGKVTMEISQRLNHGTIVGIDNSEEMIRLAKVKYPDNKFPNLSFQVMDATQLTFESDYDLIFSNAVLHWVSDHKSVLEGLYKSLNVGGKILLRMGGKGDAQGMIAAMNIVKNAEQWARYFKGFKFPYTFLGIEEYQVLLDDAGFTPIRIELLPKDMVHDGEAGLESWIRTTWLPYTGRIPEEFKTAFISEVISAYLEKVPLAADGKAHIEMVMIEVEAEKII